MLLLNLEGWICRLLFGSYHHLRYCNLVWHVPKFTSKFEFSNQIRIQRQDSELQVTTSAFRIKSKLLDSKFELRCKSWTPQYEQRRWLVGITALAQDLLSDNWHDCSQGVALWPAWRSRRCSCPEIAACVKQHTDFLTLCTCTARAVVEWTSHLLPPSPTFVARVHFVSLTILNREREERRNSNFQHSWQSTLYLQRRTSMAWS